MPSQGLHRSLALRLGMAVVVVNTGARRLSAVQFAAPTAVVELSDFDEAVDQAMAGREKKSLVMTSKERQRVAYDGAGHGLVPESRPTATRPAGWTRLPPGCRRHRDQGRTGARSKYQKPNGFQLVPACGQRVSSGSVS